MRKIPSYVLRHSNTATARKWRAMKRRQVRAAIHATKELTTGCVYLPGGPDDVTTALDALKRIQDDCSVKNWGK